MAAREREVQLGAQGRMVVPAALRKALGLKPGDRLIARTDGNCLILEPEAAIKQRLQARFSAVPEQTDLAAELIEERRREARVEAGLA